MTVNAENRLIQADSIQDENQLIFEPDSIQYENQLIKADRIQDRSFNLSSISFQQSLLANNMEIELVKNKEMLSEDRVNQQQEMI